MDDLLRRVDDRRERDAADGDTAEYERLMEIGELLIKLTLLNVCALLDSNRGGDLHRYRALFEVVRATGIGGWSYQLQQMLTGPSASSFETQSSAYIRELTQKVRRGADDSWQYESVSELANASEALGLPRTIPDRTSLLTWFDIFRDIRNKAWAHGSTSPDALRTANHFLRSSVQILLDHLRVLQLPTYAVWRTAASVIRNARLSNAIASPGCLESLPTPLEGPDIIVLTPGGVWSLLPLVHTVTDRSDYWLANGDLNERDQTYEAISYLTGSRKRISAKSYLTPPVPLPSSETHGLISLEVFGETLANLPSRKPDYVARPDVEPELLSRLLDREEDPLVTLNGMGGIGKTSTALAVLHDLCRQDQVFDFIIWFSARDVDLLSSGPTQVQPQVSTSTEMAVYAAALLRPYLDVDSFSDSMDAFRAVMRGEMFSGRVLFVFDNFETVQNPGDVFRQIKASVRLPNKALITTRHEEFKGDYPIELPRMPYPLFKELVDITASRLNIVSLINSQEEWVRKVHQESFGHPYIVRIVLGEARRRKALGNFERMLASKQEVLPALFKRTYDSLSEPAKQVMLLLCSWRSIIPMPAIEAVMTRPGNPMLDVEDAVGELEDLSLVERIRSDVQLLNVPQSAYRYVREFELQDSVYKQGIASDAVYMRMVGVQQGERGSHFSLQPFVAACLAGAGSLDKRSVDHIIQHLAEICSDGWVDAYDYYEAIDDLNSARLCLQNARRQSTEPSIPLLERSLSVYRRLGDGRQYDIAAMLAQMYRDAGQFYNLSQLTQEIARELQAGRGSSRRDDIVRATSAWKGMEHHADLRDAEALATIFKALGGMADERLKWEDVAKSRRRKPTGGRVS